MIQSATFKQIAGHLSESITVIVMAEAGAGKKAHRRVVVRCELAVAALQVEIGGPAVAKRAQIIADIHGWYAQTGEHVERCQSLRILHWRQIDNILDAAISKQRPYPLVLAARVRLGRMEWPIDAHMPQAFQGNRHCPLARPKHDVQIHATVCDKASLDR